MNTTYKRIIMLLDWIALVAKQTAIYMDLRWYVKNGESYTKLMMKRSTGMGKTYSLVLLALKYKGVIITKDKFAKSVLLDGTIVDKKIGTPIAKSYEELLEEKTNYDLILFDTGFNDEQIENIHKMGTVCVGYKQVDDIEDK